MSIFHVNLAHAQSGPSLLGYLEAESIEDAQQKVVAMLKEGGVRDEDITRNVTTYSSITLRGDVVLTVYAGRHVEDWIYVARHLMPK